MSSSKHVKTPNKPILFTTTTRSSSGRSTQTNKKAVSSRSDTTNTRQVSQRKKQESGSSLQSSKNKSQSLADSDQEIEKNNKLENIGKIEKPRRNKKATPIEELSPEELSSDNIDPFQLKGSFQQNYDKYNSQSSDLLATDDLDAKLGQKIRNFFDDNNDNESITYHVKKIKEFTDSMKPVINPENDNIDTLIENLKTRVFEHDKLREENDEILLKNKNLKNQLKEAQQQLSDYIDHPDDDDDTNISNMVKSFYHNRQNFNEYSEILRNDLDLSQKVRNFFNEEDNNDVILNTIQSNKESADDNSRVTELSSQLENLSRNAEIDKIRQINAKYQQEIEEQKEQIHSLKKEASSLYDQINSQKAEIENLNETVESKKKELLKKENEISEIKISYENQSKKDNIENRSDENYEINDSTIFELTKSYESKLEEIQNELSTKELLYNQLRNDIFQQQTLNDEKQKENMELRKFVENADDIKNKEIAFLKQRLLTELEKQKNLEMSLANGTNDEYTSSLNEQLNNKEIEITSLKNTNAKQRSIIEQKKMEISQLDQSLQKQINLLNKENAEQRSIIEQKEKEIIELKKTLDEQNNFYNEIKKSQEEMQKTHEEEELQDNQNDKLNNEQEIDEEEEHQPSVQQNEIDEDDQIQDNQNDQTNNNNPEQQSNNEQEEEEIQQETNDDKIPEQQSSDVHQDEEEKNEENQNEQSNDENPIERGINHIPQLQNDDGNEEELQDYQNELEEEEENQKTVNDEKPKHQPDVHQDEDDQIQDNQNVQSNDEQEEEEIQQITNDEKSEQQSSDVHQDEDDQIQDNQNGQSNDENSDQQSTNEQEEEEIQQITNDEKSEQQSSDVHQDEDNQNVQSNDENSDQQSTNEQEEEEIQQITNDEKSEQQSSDFPQDEDDQNSQSNDENSDQQQSTINPIEREIKDIDDSQEIDQQKEIVKEENTQIIKEETNNDDNNPNTESINESNQPTETETTTPTNESPSTEETSYNVLENYELLKPFAHGGFGKVYKVRDKSTGEIYAAKISKNSIVNDDQTKLNIRREVNILSKLNHPGVLQFICYSPVNFKNEPRPVIITQYAENHTLSDMIKLERESRAHKDWNDTRKLIVLYGIASAMSFLHSNRIVHRDLKPTNILMDEHLHPKIGDFGLSKVQHSEASASISQSGIKGTIVYLPPEVFQDSKAYSESSDVYAFGMIAYEVITSQIPFQGLNQNELIAKIQKGERPTIDDNQILPAYKFLIQSCWDQDPSKRPTFSMIVDSLGGDDGFRDFDGFDEDEFLKYVYFIEDCKDKITFDTTPNKDINKYIVSQEKTFKTYTVDIPDKTSASPLQKEEEKEEDKQSNKKMCPKEYYEQLDEDRKHLIDEAENDPIKQCIVGQFLVEGIEGFPQETDLGIQYLDKSIEAGCTQACNYYCNLLIRGQFVDYNLELAEKYLEKQLKSHNGTVYLLYGRVMRKFEKFDLAQKYFKKGANLGNNEAMYEYGKMMYRGEGCEKNEKEANVYFDLAKKNGNYKAYEFVFKQQKEEERKRKRNELNS